MENLNINIVHYQCNINIVLLTISQIMNMIMIQEEEGTLTDEEDLQKITEQDLEQKKHNPHQNTMEKNQNLQIGDR